VERGRYQLSSVQFADHHLMAQYITSKAKEAGAADNLTLIVVYLKPLKEIWEKEWA
jgi:hypothetical protein